MANQNIFLLWLHVRKNYPAVAERALKCLLPFATTYLCESGFSLKQNKNGTRICKGFKVWRETCLKIIVVP